MEKTLVTVREAARVLGIGRSLAYRYVMNGKLKSIKLGRLRRIPTAVLNDFINEQISNGED